MFVPDAHMGSVSTGPELVHCQTVYDVRRKQINRYFDNDNDNDESDPNLFFEWESSFWNKILLQWWGWVVEASFFPRAVLLLLCFVVLRTYRRLGLTNRYFDNDNDESQPKFFLSGSLHFGIKFFCCDEDESSKLCLSFERCFLLRWYVLSYRRFFVVKWRFSGRWNLRGHPYESQHFQSIFSTAKKVLDCTGKNWFRAAPEDRIPKNKKPSIFGVAFHGTDFFGIPGIL